MQIPDLSDIPQPEAKEAGEYGFRITSVKDTQSDRTGRTGVIFILKLIDVENAKPIYHRVWFPMDSDDKDKKILMWNMCQEFFEAMGFPKDGGFDTSEMINTEAVGIFSLGQDFNDNEANELVRVTG